MRIPIKSRNYLKKCLGFLLILGFISLGAIGGCNNGGGQDGGGDLGGEEPEEEVESTSIPSYCSVVGTEQNQIACLLPSDVNMIDLSDLASDLSSEGVTDSTTFWIQAWGGLGGKGTATAGPGAGGGSPGYAQAIMTVESYISASGVSDLYYYLGKNGGDRAGGASTIVMSDDLTDKKPCLIEGLSGFCTSSGGICCDASDCNTVLVAGGGGGGSDQFLNNNFVFIEGATGGDGGVLIATLPAFGDQTPISLCTEQVTECGRAGDGSGKTLPAGTSGIGGSPVGDCSNENPAETVFVGNGGFGAKGGSSSDVYWENFGSAFSKLSGNGGEGGQGTDSLADGGGAGGGAGSGQGGIATTDESSSEPAGAGGGGGSFATNLLATSECAPTTAVTSPDDSLGRVQIVFYTGTGDECSSFDVLDSGTVEVKFDCVESGSKTADITGGGINGQFPTSGSVVFDQGNGNLEVTEGSTTDTVLLSNLIITAESCSGCSETECFVGTGDILVQNVPVLGNVTGKATLCGTFDDSTNTYTFSGDVSDLNPTCLTSVKLTDLMLEENE